MTCHQLSNFAANISKKYVFSTLLTCCSLGASSLYAQTLAEKSPDVRVAIDWHTVAEPMYGASYLYRWNDVHGYSKDGAEIPTVLELQVSRDDGGGAFTLLSTPIAVPGAGMRLTFDRQVIMHPSTAERGTLLPNDPQDKCKNQKNGVSRAVFHQRIDIVDAETGIVLAPHVDENKFDITRYQALNDIDQSNNVAIDLTPFAGRQIAIRAVVIASYNGRGPSRSTTPTISGSTTQTQHDIK